MVAGHEMLIDRVSTVASRPMAMEVLAFGMSRTGTMSLQHALHRLGYKCYHMTEVAPNGAFNYWLEALKAKYFGEGRPYQRAEFDKLLGNYSAVTDMPCILFVDELLAAYPSAKVILTERDVDSWVVSMNKTVFEILSWRSFNYIAPLEPKIVGPFWKTFNCILRIWTGGNLNDREKLRQTYRDHYTHVRKVVPKNKLLDFKPHDGYKELCEFLNKPQPGEESYPHINQPDNIIKMFKTLWWRTFWNALTRVGGGISAIIVVITAIWYYK